MQIDVLAFRDPDREHVRIAGLKQSLEAPDAYREIFGFRLLSCRGHLLMAALPERTGRPDNRVELCDVVLVRTAGARAERWIAQDLQRRGANTDPEVPRSENGCAKNIVRLLLLSRKQRDVRDALSVLMHKIIDLRLVMCTEGDGHAHTQKTEGGDESECDKARVMSYPIAALIHL